MATSTVPASSRARSPCRQCGSESPAIGDLVADAVDRAQVLGVARVGLDLPAQVHDVHVDGPLGDVAVEPVGLLDELAAAEHLVRRRDEGGEEAELGWCARDL